MFRGLITRGFNAAPATLPRFPVSAHFLTFRQRSFLIPLLVARKAGLHCIDLVVVRYRSLYSFLCREENTDTKGKEDFPQVYCEIRSGMFPLLLLSAICSLASSSVPDQESDHSRLLKVTVSKTPPVSAVLGSSITLACFVSLAETPTAFGRQAVHTVPLVKWSVLSSGLETEILVARGGRVKVSEVYKGRASLPNYFSSSTNLTLRLEGLRYNDSGVYRCMTQQGLEDSYDQVPVKVKGVVFHYRHASSLYAFSFPEAQTACEDIGARMATPAQFLAGYQGGPEPCTAGWVSDQTVRNPIQFPEEGCFGDKEKERGLWNYTGRDPSELWDVFCYVEDVTGKVLYSCTPQHLTFKEAQDYCQAGGTDLATLAQVYAAWNDGLHHCSPGWLADGSVRYPVGDSRENCRGSTPGVKTIYRFSNQTSFPEPHTLHSVYCFQGPKSSPVDDSKECMETKSEKTNGGTMAMMGPLQEIILGQENEPNGGGHVGGQVEDQGTMRNLHTVTSLVDTSSPTDSQNLATPAPESKDAKALMKGAINHEPLAETNLKVLTAISPEMLIGNSKRYRKMNLKSSDPISEMPANSKHNQRVTQTNLENGGINPPNQMAGDGSKHYQDMPATNLESVGAPPEGTAEPFASFSPTKSAMTGDDVKAVYREDNISAPEEFRNTGTLPTQKTESFVTLDYVQTSKSGTDFAQEQSSAALPDSSSPVKQAGQEAVDGSVEIPTGSGDSKEIFLGSFDPVMSSHQSQSADIFAGAESRQKPLGLMWPDSSAPSDDVEASGHAAIESSTGSAVLGGGCFRNPCANGGTCVEVGASAKCLCLPTYGGHLCQTDLAPCDADWQKFQGFCYRHFTDQQAWEEAEQHCRAHGGHLTSVRTPEEQDFIYNNYRDYQWIGLNDRTIEGDFDWSDGSPLLYENWKTGQPDSYFLSGEDCGVMVWQDGGRWSDVPCNYHLSYICKKGTAFCGEPPTLPNTQVFSKGHPHHEVSSMVRYYCVDGFLPRHNPIIKCLPNGQWEEPQFMCVPVNSAEDNQATESQPGRGIIVEDTTTRKAAAEFRDINWNI
ncbi:brevican core protein isoform X4 [Brienomyrus brachyistius]|uniref:brevican core protein isoform X4 n=1 Tax=Brienomyrus brachyistius TaxID=42636 RepID=UPI0020B27538|nr:brevican core protein isoform X4 [Brienomyrus brachyistius]